MNFSPENRTTLETLLAGLRSGVSGSQAAPILAATLQAQQQQQAERQQRYQDMAQQVLGLASQGMPYGATSNIVDALTPGSGIPGRFQGLMNQAFANPDIPANLMGQYADYANSPAALASGSAPLPASLQNQLQSPLYTQSPASAGAFDPTTGGLMTAPEQAQMQAAMAAPQPAAPSVTEVKQQQLGTLVQGIQTLKNQGRSGAEIRQALLADPQWAGVFASNLQALTPIFPDVVTGA